MLILDLFCCAGGAARGYKMAGFDVVGVDITRYEDYPYEFFQWDAIDTLNDLLSGYALGSHELDDFDAIHASPPCQRWANLMNCRPGNADAYPDLIGPVRELLIATGKPYIIENVPGAPLVDPVMLCGTQLGRRFRLHRSFETNFPLPQLDCHHEIGVLNPENNHGRAKIREEFPGESVWAVFNREKGISDMRYNGKYKKQAREAISPYYTEHVARYLASHLATQLMH